MEQNNANPQGPGLLDDVDQATPFDMDGMIDDASTTQKQQYEHSFVDPEEAFPDPDPLPQGRIVGEKARRATANALMMMADRAQAATFTLFGAKGHAEDFRFSKVDREEMSGYLMEGIPENWQLPWYVPFSVLFLAAIGGNVTKLQDIKATKRRAEQEEANRKAREEREAKAKAEDAALKERYDERREQRAERRQAPPPPPPPPTAPEKKAPVVDPNAHLCEECETRPTPMNHRFCSATCRARANGRKAAAVHTKRAEKK